MRRSALTPGKTLKRRTPLKRGDGLKRATQPRQPRAISPASNAQRAKVAAQVCAVCQHDSCDPAHLCPRAWGGCDSPDCVIALCRHHHREFDQGGLDLLPWLSGRGFNAELAHMQGHYDDPLSVLYRLSGRRWAPVDERRAA